ncbi:MAG: ATP-binding protein [Lewinellaceae bacterium]|nr:ATP-binding protein [Lewinellaceae bacterium]
MITRAASEMILKNLSVFPAANIIGPRQVGKTTLAKWLQTRLSKPSFYLDLQNIQDLDKLAAPGLFLREHAEKCVIIDEVQRLPGLFAQLRSLIDERREPARFVLLGSASPSIIKGVSESLAGRVFTELMPFSPRKYGNRAWRKHLGRGGFPDALMPDDDLAAEWFESFTRTFVERDLRELGYNLTSVLFSRLLRMAAHLNGQLLNMSTLANSLTSAPTLSRYLDLLEGGFLVHRLMPWFSNAGKRLVKSPKLYIRDSGLLHHLLRIRDYDTLLGHPGLGASWEGYVIEQIIRVTQRKWEYYFYRTQHGAEADLVLVRPDGKIYCIEVKFSSAPVLGKGFIRPKKIFNRIILLPSYPKANRTRRKAACG